MVDVHIVNVTSRIHILLDDAEKARYKRQAEREGKSLGGWLRAAAAARLEAAELRVDLRTRAGLEAFFADCDERETGQEPEWADHRASIDRSRLRGLDIP